MMASWDEVSIIPHKGKHKFGKIISVLGQLFLCLGYKNATHLILAVSSLFLSFLHMG